MKRQRKQESGNNPEKKPHVTVRFVTPEDVGPRPWGREILFALLPGEFSGKLLKYNAGHRGRLQRHHKKHEFSLVIEGQMILRCDAGDGKLSERILGPGECVEIPPGAVHQEEAITELTVVEVGTPHFNDREGMEEHYGLPVPEGALPTTTIDEVETR